jgi:hypothetical protein
MDLDAQAAADVLHEVRHGHRLVLAIGKWLAMRRNRNAPTTA